jgi:hypothetical protein
MTINPVHINKKQFEYTVFPVWDVLNMLDIGQNQIECNLQNLER